MAKIKKGAASFDQHFNMSGLDERAREVDESPRTRRYAYWSPKNGTSVVRILPPGNNVLMAQGSMGQLVYKHFLYWNRKNQGIHICGPQTDPDNYNYCPICDALDRVQDVVPEQDWKRQRARARAFFNVLIRRLLDSEKEEVDKKKLWGKIVVLEGPAMIYDWITSASADPEIGFFMHPIKGADLVIRRKGEGIDTQYDLALKPGEWTPIDPEPDRVDTILEGLTDLLALNALTEERIDEAKKAARLLLRWGSSFGEIDDDLGGSSAQLEEMVERAASKKKTQKQKVAEKEKDDDVDLDTLFDDDADADDADDDATDDSDADDATDDSDSGTVRPPKLGDNKMPVCFGEFEKRNPGVDMSEADIRPKDPQCKLCDFRTPCSYSTDAFGDS